MSTFPDRGRGLLVLVHLLGACSYEVEPIENIAMESAALYSSTNDGPVSYWPLGDPIPVCVKPFPGSGYTWQSGTFTSVRVAAQQIVEAEYESIPGAEIEFTDWGQCPAVTPGGTIELSINSAAGSGQTTGTGYTAGGVRPVKIGNGPSVPGGWVNAEDLNSTVLHEFAHALGFDHELRRADSGIKYVNGVGCVPGLSTYGNDGVTEWVGPRFTVNDFGSIMNATYCFSLNGTVDGQASLSKLDELGLEIVYPARFEHEIVLKDATGFRTPDGIVIRSDAEGALISEWTHRGATRDAFRYGDYGVNWYIGASTPAFWQVGLELPLEDLPNVETVTVSAVYYDFAEREHELVPTDFIVDSSLHAALVVAAL